MRKKLNLTFKVGISQGKYNICMSKIPKCVELSTQYWNEIKVQKSGFGNFNLEIYNVSWFMMHWK